MEQIKFNYPVLLKKNGLKSKEIGEKIEGFIPKLKSVHKLVDKINEVMDEMNDDDSNATDGKEKLDGLFAVAEKYDEELCGMIKDYIKKSEIEKKEEQKKIDFEESSKKEQEEKKRKENERTRRNIWGL